MRESVVCALESRVNVSMNKRTIAKIVAEKDIEKNNVHGSTISVNRVTLLNFGKTNIRNTVKKIDGPKLKMARQKFGRSFIARPANQRSYNPFDGYQ